MLLYQNHILDADQNSLIPPARKPFVPHSGSRNCNRTNPTVVGGKPFIDGEHEIPFSRLIQNPPTVLYQNHFIVADSKSFVPPPRKSLIARNPSSHSASPNHSRTNPTVVDEKPFVVRWKWKALKLEVSFFVSKAFWGLRFRLEKRRSNFLFTTTNICMKKMRIKDTNRSNATQPMASKSHGISALMLSHSVVLITHMTKQQRS